MLTDSVYYWIANHILLQISTAALLHHWLADGNMKTWEVSKFVGYHYYTANICFNYIYLMYIKYVEYK